MKHYLESSEVRVGSGMKLDTFYVVEDGTTAWSPDGVGAIWYDSLDEAEEEHGNLPTIFLSERALEDIREGI